MSEQLPNVRAVQFQMSTCPETGGAFNITSYVPRDANAAAIAAELATLREAGFHEMAAANKRKLQRAEIIKTTLTERLTGMQKKGDPVNKAKVKDAIESANADTIILGAEITADEQMLAPAPAEPQAQE